MTSPAEPTEGSNQTESTAATSAPPAQQHPEPNMTPPVQPAPTGWQPVPPPGQYYYVSTQPPVDPKLAWRRRMPFIATAAALLVGLGIGAGAMALAAEGHGGEGGHSQHEAGQQSNDGETNDDGGPSR